MISGRQRATMNSIRSTLAAKGGEGVVYAISLPDSTGYRVACIMDMLHIFQRLILIKRYKKLKIQLLNHDDLYQSSNTIKINA